MQKELEKIRDEQWAQKTSEWKEYVVRKLDELRLSLNEGIST